MLVDFFFFKQRNRKRRGARWKEEKEKEWQGDGCSGKRGKKKKNTQRDGWAHLASFIDRRRPMAASPLVDAHYRFSSVSSLSSSSVSVCLSSKTFKEMKSHLLQKVLHNRLKAKCPLSPFAHSFYFFTNKSFFYC